MLKYIFALLSAPLLANGCFTGFDATIGVGYSQAVQLISIDDPTASVAISTELSDGSVAVLGRVGYGWDFCQCAFFGIEGYAQYNNLEVVHDLRNPGGNYKHTHTFPVDLGVDARFGLAYRDTQMLYVAIGPDWIYLKERFEASRHSTAYDNTWLIGPRLAGGAEQRVCGKLILKEELSYAWYDEQKKLVGNPAAPVTYKLKPRLASFTFSAGYLF